MENLTLVIIGLLATIGAVVCFICVLFVSAFLVGFIGELFKRVK